MGGLLRSNLTVATGTALSRVTGLLRTVALGYVLGQTALTDAYIIGNETPNVVYELLVGGMLSATLVPLFSSFYERDDEESANVVITTTVVLLLAATLLAILAAPWIFQLYTTTVGEGVDPATFRDAGTALTRIFLIQILFYGITAIANAVANSRGRFFAAAWTPIAANLITVAALLSLPDGGADGWVITDVLDDSRLRYTLALAPTLGIATMATIMLVSIRRAGFRFRPAFRRRHPALRRLLTMSAWTLGYVIANQAAIVVVRNLTDPGSGDASAYFYAYTFFVLPHGLLGVSIATTFTPSMSRAVARRDKPSFISQASLGVRLVALLTLPAGVLLFVLRRPVIGLLLERGNFTANDALVTSRALGGFALGLVAFSVYLFILRGFYAHHDTRTPFIINVVKNGLNIALAFALVGAHGVLGLGAAFAISSVVAGAWALRVLSYKLPEFPLRDVLVSLWRILVAGALAGEAAWFFARALGSNTGPGAILRITAAAIAALAVYIAVLAVLKAPELTAAKKRLDALLGRSPSLT